MIGYVVYSVAAAVMSAVLSIVVLDSGWLMAVGAYVVADLLGLVSI